MAYCRLILMCLMLSGCSIVQWLPSSACEYVSYERNHNKVDVVASCTL
jgi:hypothetical protein